MSAPQETEPGMETPPPTLFDAVAKRHYEGMVDMYAMNAKNAVASYLAMKSRWTSGVSLAEEKSGEKKSHVQKLCRILQDLFCEDLRILPLDTLFCDCLMRSRCFKCRA
jgi:hypothetical protein